MTIPEASQLILQAGEKLFEELITEGEGIRETEHGEIMVLKAQRLKVEGERLDGKSGKSGMIGMDGGLDGKSGKSGMIGMDGGLDGKSGKSGMIGMDGGRMVGGGLSLKVLRKHIKRLVNYAEAGDGVKIREELKRVVPEYKPKG